MKGSGVRVSPSALSRVAESTPLVPSASRCAAVRSSRGLGNHVREGRLMRLHRYRLVAIGVLGVVALGVVLAGAALAVLSGSSIPTYTRCMTVSGGTVSALRE